MKCFRYRITEYVIAYLMKSNLITVIRIEMSNHTSDSIKDVFRCKIHRFNLLPLDQPFMLCLMRVNRCLPKCCSQCFCPSFSARCVHRTNRRAIIMMYVRVSVCPSVRLSGAGVHCDHAVHFSADLSS